MIYCNTCMAKWNDRCAPLLKIIRKVFGFLKWCRPQTRRSALRLRAPPAPPSSLCAPPSRALCAPPSPHAAQPTDEARAVILPHPVTGHSRLHISEISNTTEHPCRDFRKKISFNGSLEWQRGPQRKTHLHARDKHALRPPLRAVDLQFM